MKKSFQRLLYTSLLICSFMFLCGVDACERGYLISGTVSGEAQSGVTITLSGDDSDSTITNLNGDYTFSGLENGSYAVIPTKSGYTFSPVSENITISDSDETEVDFIATDVVITIGRFTDNGDGTVTDARTGLLWLKDANCFNGSLNWNAAMLFVAGLNSGECGLTDESEAGDWSLPTKADLQGIGTDPPSAWEDGPPSGIWTTPSAPFVSVFTSHYWSCTEYYTIGLAWNVFMGHGGTYASDKIKDYYYVWPVRDAN